VHVQDDRARETTMDSGRMVGPRRRVEWVRKRRPEGKPELVGPMTHGEEGTVMVGTVPCSGGGSRSHKKLLGTDTRKWTITGVHVKSEVKESGWYLQLAGR
jgi:hypothetical protein